MTKISDQETDIKRQLVWYENLLELIQNEKQLLANSHNLIGKYHLGYRPDIYRLDMQNRLELHANKNLKQTIRHWTNQTPFVFTSALLEKAKLTTDYSEYSDYSCGLSVLKKYAEFLGIEESKHVKYFPACACVYTVLQTSVDSPFRPALLKPAIEFMKSNELNIAGDALSKSIVMQRKDSKYVNMHFVWIPYQ